MNTKWIKLLCWRRRILEIAAIVIALTGMVAAVSAIGGLCHIRQIGLVWSVFLVAISFIALILCHVLQAAADGAAWEIVMETQKDRIP